MPSVRSSCPFGLLLRRVVLVVPTCFRNAVWVQVYVPLPSSASAISQNGVKAKNFPRPVQCRNRHT